MVFRCVLGKRFHERQDFRSLLDFVEHNQGILRVHVDSGIDAEIGYEPLGVVAAF